MIGNGSDVTMISFQSYPKQYLKDVCKPIQVIVASGQFTTLTKAVLGQYIALHDTTTGTHKIVPLPTIVIQTPKAATYNILLGVDLLK